MLEKPTFLDKSTPNQSPIQHRNASPTLSRSHSPSQLQKVSYSINVPFRTLVDCRNTLSQVALQLRPTQSAADGFLSESTGSNLVNEFKGESDGNVSSIPSTASAGGSLSSIPTTSVTYQMSTSNQPSTTSSSVAAAAAAAASAVTSAVTTITSTIGGTLSYKVNTLNETRHNSQASINPDFVIDENSTAQKRGKETSNLEKEKYRAMVESNRPLGFTNALELECFRIQLLMDEHTRDNVRKSLCASFMLIDYIFPPHRSWQNWGVPWNCTTHHTINFIETKRLRVLYVKLGQRLGIAKLGHKTVLVLWQSLVESNVRILLQFTLLFVIIWSEFDYSVFIVESEVAPIA